MSKKKSFQVLVECESVRQSAKQDTNRATETDGRMDRWRKWNGERKNERKERSREEREQQKRQGRRKEWRTETESRLGRCYSSGTAWAIMLVRAIDDMRNAEQNTRLHERWYDNANLKEILGIDDHAFFSWHLQPDTNDKTRNETAHFMKSADLKGSQMRAKHFLLLLRKRNIERCRETRDTERKTNTRMEVMWWEPDKPSFSSSPT